MFLAWRPRGVCSVSLHEAGWFRHYLSGRAERPSLPPCRPLPPAPSLRVRTLACHARTCGPASSPVCRHFDTRLLAHKRTQRGQRTRTHAQKQKSTIHPAVVRSPVLPLLLCVCHTVRACVCNAHTPQILLLPFSKFGQGARRARRETLNPAPLARGAAKSGRQRATVQGWQHLACNWLAECKLCYSGSRSLCICASLGAGSGVWYLHCHSYWSGSSQTNIALPLLSGFVHATAAVCCCVLGSCHSISCNHCISSCLA
jgi:hypothetical protein